MGSKLHALKGLHVPGPGTYDGTKNPSIERVRSLRFGNE